ncbi:MAG: hypothetical protein ACPKM0_11945 [Pleomorphochaeta sp.]
MTNPLFFDTDGLSAFLWVDKQSILSSLYPGRIAIPQDVYNELSYPGVNHLRKRLDKLITYKHASIIQITIPSEEYTIFEKLTKSPNKGYPIIGKGEAACIALAKNNEGIIASNNLKDISQYIREYNLINITTGDILKEALNSRILTKKQCEIIWQNMLHYRRKLGSNSFEEFLNKSESI